eukprot:symbB.v1.2.034200.t1/scaffold4369.1/size40568/4
MPLTVGEWIARSSTGDWCRPSSHGSTMPRRHLVWVGLWQMLLVLAKISPVAGWNETAHARRLTAVDVAYEVTAVDGSNVQAEPQSTSNVNLRAGVTYTAFIIHAASGLGTSKRDIRAKLVPYDMKSTLQTCQTVNAYMGFPFNGAENAVIPGQTPETIRNFSGRRWNPVSRCLVRRALAIRSGVLLTA